jgi:hypothetical protein
MLLHSKNLHELAELLSDALGQMIEPVGDTIELAGENALDRVLIEQGKNDGALHLIIPLHVLDPSERVLESVVNLLLQLNADVSQLGKARMAFNSTQGEFILMDQFQPDLSGALAQLNERRALAMRIRQAIRQLVIVSEEA